MSVLRRRVAGHGGGVAVSVVFPGVESGRPQQRSARMRVAWQRLVRSDGDDTVSVRSELRAAALERDGYRCRFPDCGLRGGRPALEMAHLVQSSQGGPDTLENVVMLCKAHHDWLDNRQHTVKGRREMNRELLEAYLAW